MRQDCISAKTTGFSQFIIIFLGGGIVPGHLNLPQNDVRRT